MAVIKGAPKLINCEEDDDFSSEYEKLMAETYQVLRMHITMTMLDDNCLCHNPVSKRTFFLRVTHKGQASLSRDSFFHCS